MSRLVGAVAAVMADEKGLNWPKAIAPFETIVLCKEEGEDAIKGSLPVTDKLAEVGVEDVVVDDRSKGLGWKMNDADLIGYPIIVVMGRAWKNDGRVEVQCRRLGIREEVVVEKLGSFVAECLQRL